MKTLHKRTARKILVTAAAAIIGGTGLAIAPPQANADPIGCETIRWGFLGSQLRTICDGPRRDDGSWLRAREVWTPAGYVPIRTSCSQYSCTTTGGYYRQRSTQAFETYIVFDHNVLPDEPGWLPPGTNVIR